MHPLVQLASRLRAPDLVRVVVRARPHLKGISGGLVAAREIDAETLVLDCNTQVVGVVERLGDLVGNAGLKVKAGTIGESSGSDAGVRAGVLDGGLAVVYDPSLGASAVACIDGDARTRLASDNTGRRREAASQVAIGVKGGPRGGLTSYETVEGRRKGGSECDGEDGEVGEHGDRRK